MSRYHPEWNIEPILDAAKHWRVNALEGRGSILGSGAVWSDENLEALNKYFVENLDYGEGNFLSKLRGQLEPAPAGAKQLAAEMLWFMLLCPSNIGPDNKRDTIYTVWGWSETARPKEQPWLTDEVLAGIGSAGTAYNTQRWRELVFFIRFMKAFRALESSKHRQLLTDGWQFATWIEVVPEANKRQLRHMIQYLLFPEKFDRIFGRQHRSQLLLAFTKMTKSEIANLSVLEISREIQRIRKEKEDKYQTRELDFYVSPLKELWLKPDEADEDQNKDQDEDQPPFDKYTRGLRRQHVLDALAEIDREDYPADARSSTYDLIYKHRRYPPKYVLSLSTKYVMGERLPRQFFSGGKDSQAFRILKNLGFHIEIKTFIPDLVEKFLTQADEGTSLVVSEYPKYYRGLKVNVSFGKGNFSKIPWISFTGYGQTTSDGIYPVVLYYKAISLLIVAYGISETHTPKLAWKNLGPAKTIAAYLESQGTKRPERYGTSYVHTPFNLEEDIDYKNFEHGLDDLIGKYHEQFEQELGAKKKNEDVVKEPPLDEQSEPEKYEIAEALNGLFVEETRFRELLKLLEQKKNLILQGPPGVGKTFLCRRLAYALIGQKAPSQVGMVQFHQSYAYEDFIQGYRPSSGGFRLKNGVFYEFCQKAKNDPASTYVFVIDEINRGNLSKVFGELMLLIEADKRGPDWAIPLTYSDDMEDMFYVPENVYLIGLMNTADRSLAMVDYALRRRFAFGDLAPGFETEEFQQYLLDRGADQKFIDDLVNRLHVLNAKISADSTNLGPGFCIGHSFFCAIADGQKVDWAWFKRIIKSEIEPLLREYYFDDEKQASALVAGLLFET